MFSLKNGGGLEKGKLGHLLTSTQNYQRSGMFIWICHLHQRFQQCETRIAHLKYKSQTLKLHLEEQPAFDTMKQTFATSSSTKASSGGEIL